MSGEGILSPRGDTDRYLTKRLRRGMIVCPYCGDNCAIRSHERETDTASTLRIHCLNTDCGATYRYQLALVYQLSPSAIARPDLNLPQAPEDVRRAVYPPGGTEAPDPRQIGMFEQGGDEEEPGKAARAA